ncbi:MAG: ABC transporter ATP-binding protein [Candidatus Goldiibacteriota bacterium]
MIEISGLAKNYGGFKAVDNLDLKAGKGEIFGFLGPNGAGKTTTIKMMTGLIRPDAGKVCIDGICLDKDPIEYKKKFALIPDNPYMFEKLRGIEYIEFIANIYGVSKTDFEERLREYSEVFKTKNFLNDFIESYSHGMRQKLLLTASMIHKPCVLILDEPMVGLDPRSKKILVSELKKVAGEGMTVFMSTHSIETAEEVCTHAGIIDKGRLVSRGEMKDIKSTAASGKLEEVFFKLTEENYGERE